MGETIKRRIRERIWEAMEREGVALFPGAFGRIPNFVGAHKAAENLNELEEWRAAKRIKANPDSPQSHARRLALRQGKIVFMAVPRLREERCFVMIDPKMVRGRERFAGTIKGAFALGRQVHPEEMPRIDLVLLGSVAVNLKGARVGKGGGYSDLEFALARQLGLVDESTPVITTVHPIQIVDDEIPMLPHDVPVDYIITPEGIIRTERAYSKPKGILWDLLEEGKLESIPILRRLRTSLIGS
ncbi:5-formyltetrahydrofolate cyclo-ligase [Candidatus Poribacteria bacterium]|nr:MAG: 5-formyltetrahydrofolate cyclo-ligase [Candidatus Poribacteria bacterium]